MARILLALLTLSLLAPGTGVRAADLTVAVRPCEIYNAPDLTPLAGGFQSMLASRVAAPGFTVLTVGEEEGLDTDWALHTTITHFGGVYSLDVSLEALRADLSSSRSYEMADSEQKLMAALEKVAQRIREDLTSFAPQRLARPSPVPLPSAPPAATPPAAAPPVAAPPVQPAPAPLTAPAVARPQPGPAPVQTEGKDLEDLLQTVLQTGRESPSTEGEATGLVVTDVDGDGTPEILLLAGKRIVAFRDVGTEIAQAWSSPTPDNLEPSLLSAGDVDGNGRPELFIAGMAQHRPVTQALEWSGTALVPKGGRTLGYLRAVARPDRGAVLVGGAPAAGDGLFAPHVFSYRWGGDSYERDERFGPTQRAVPGNIDLVPLVEGTAPYFLVTEQQGRLILYDPEGRQAYESDYTVKGTKRILLGEPHATGTQELQQDVARAYGKAATWHAPDGTPIVLVPKNHAGLSKFFSRVISFDHGQVLALRWDDYTLSPTAEGPKIPGHFPDVDLGPTPGAAGQTLYVARAQTEGTVKQTAWTTIVAYDLPGASTH